MFHQGERRRKVLSRTHSIPHLGLDVCPSVDDLFALTFAGRCRGRRLTKAHPLGIMGFRRNGYRVVPATTKAHGSRIVSKVLRSHSMFGPCDMQTEYSFVPEHFDPVKPVGVRQYGVAARVKYTSSFPRPSLRKCAVRTTARSLPTDTRSATSTCSTATDVVACRWDGEQIYSTRLDRSHLR